MTDNSKAIQEMIEEGRILLEPANGEKLELAIGDSIIFTNDYGVEFDDLIVTGYCPENHSLYKYGNRYFLSKDSYWYPVHPTNCRRQLKQTISV